MHFCRLVSTDGMARGMDIENVEVVVSYDAPKLKTYIHRVGRTARAGRSGTSLLMIPQTNVSLITMITLNRRNLKLI